MCNAFARIIFPILLLLLLLSLWVELIYKPDTVLSCLYVFNLLILIQPYEIGNINIYLFMHAAPRSMWDPSPPTRDQTRAPCSGSMAS